jgi:hypothetical protein
MEHCGTQLTAAMCHPLTKPVARITCWCCARSFTPEMLNIFHFHSHQTSNNATMVEKTTNSTATTPLSSKRIMENDDIRWSFEVLDDDLDGWISIQAFHTLFRGLGYQPATTTLAEMEQWVTDCSTLSDPHSSTETVRVSWTMALSILSQV